MWGSFIVALATVAIVSPIYESRADNPFTVTCANPSWVGTPAMNNQGRLAATLTSACKIILNTSGSIAHLDGQVLASVPSSYTVNSGPTSETFEGLPSVLYDVTAKTKDNGDDVTIRSQLHVATDQATQFDNTTVSTQIDGTGNAGYLKVLNEEQKVVKDPKVDTTFDYYQTQSVELEKPWYAPEGIFISEAEKGLMSSFSTELSKLSQDTAKQLLAP